MPLPYHIFSLVSAISACFCEPHSSITCGVLAGGEISKYNQEKIPLNDSGEANHAKTSPSIGDVNATSTVANASGENVSATASIMEKTDQSALEVVGNISPRLNFSLNSRCHTTITLHLRDYSYSHISPLVILYGIVS